MTTLPPPCRCGHDDHDDGPCTFCLCREFVPDEYVYPAGPLVAS